MRLYPSIRLVRSPLIYIILHKAITRNLFRGVSPLPHSLFPLSFSSLPFFTPLHRGCLRRAVSSHRLPSSLSTDNFWIRLWVHYFIAPPSFQDRNNDSRIFSIILNMFRVVCKNLEFPEIHGSLELHPFGPRYDCTSVSRLRIPVCCWNKIKSSYRAGHPRLLQENI